MYVTVVRDIGLIWLMEVLRSVHELHSVLSLGIVKHLSCEFALALHTLLVSFSTCSFSYMRRGLMVGRQLAAHESCCTSIFVVLHHLLRWVSSTETINTLVRQIFIIVLPIVI